MDAEPIYCCYHLQECVATGEFLYYPQFRSIWVYFRNTHDGGYGAYCMQYCIFCGAKLPPALDVNDAYYDALEEALGKEFCDIKEEEIPEEFKTEEWWRKRGL